MCDATSLNELMEFFRHGAKTAVSEAAKSAVDSVKNFVKSKLGTKVRQSAHELEQAPDDQSKQQALRELLEAELKNLGTNEHQELRGLLEEIKNVSSNRTQTAIAEKGSTIKQVQIGKLKKLKGGIHF